MAGFPETGTHIEIGLYTNQLAGPVSLSSFVNQNKGPGRMQKRGDYHVCPMSRERKEAIERIGHAQ